MTEWRGKRYWLVGASEGLGSALAQRLSGAGANLVLSARSEDRLKDLAARLPAPVEVRPVDVSDTESVRDAAERVGEVDGLVYLAGVYWPMPATEWNADHAEAMANVNFTGLIRMMGAVVPGMVERDRGHVVVTGSLSGFRGLPGAIGYGASKAGVMSLAETMRSDLRKTGVKVQLVNPGFIRTRLTEKNAFRMPQLMEPEDAARAIFEHMNTESFSLSFPRPFSWLMRASQFLPDGIYYRLFS